MVLGGEIHLWSERSDPYNAGRVIWPRSSAAGEVLWSGRQDLSGQNRSQIDTAVGLSDLRGGAVVGSRFRTDSDGVVHTISGRLHVVSLPKPYALTFGSIGKHDSL